MPAQSAARRREDLTAWLIFVTLLGMAAALTVALLTEERPSEVVVKKDVRERVYRGHGVVHPKFSRFDGSKPSMLQGGPGRERHERILIPAGILLALAVVFGVACIYLGTLRSAGPSPLKWPLVLAGLIGCGIVAAIFVTYWRFVSQGEPDYFLGLPAPTAWMMYGFWSFPLLILFYFVFWFDRWYAPPQINDDFQRIVAATHGEPEDD